MRNRLVELLLLLAALAVWMRLGSPQSGSVPNNPVTASAWQANLINGIAYHSTMEQAEKLLGVSPCRGSLKVGKHGQEDGYYEEWGGSQSITWQGSPTLTFFADKGLLCTIGNVLTLGKSEFALGSSRQEIEAVFGAPTQSETSNEGVDCSYRSDDQNLHLTYNRDGLLSKILRESLR